VSVRFPYDAGKNPPMPVMPVRVGTVRGVWSSAVPSSIVDTGADITVIPARLAGDLRLATSGEVQVRGATGGTVRARLFTATVDVAGYEVTLPVVGLGRELIIGRDIINRFTVVLRGPERVLEVEPGVSSASG